MDCSKFEEIPTDDEDVLKYVRYELVDGTDTDELIKHLDMNGYRFGFDSRSNALFVWDEEADYVETILEDRSIFYEKEVC